MYTKHSAFKAGTDYFIVNASNNKFTGHSLFCGNQNVCNVCSPYSDFDQLPDNIPVTATIADIEEKKGFIVYFVSFLNPVDLSFSLLVCLIV